MNKEIVMNPDILPTLAEWKLICKMVKASEKATCNKCNDTGWVCEWHPDKEAHKCCGGAGMPCECTKGEK